MPLWPLILIALYCLLIAGASLAGGVLPATLRLTHTRMQVIMSFVGGLVLGVALLHLLPHSVAETGPWIDDVGGPGRAVDDVLADPHFPGPPARAGRRRRALPPRTPRGGGEHCEHITTPRSHRKANAATRTNMPYSWIGLCVGLSLHTLIDGMALAASVSADTHAGTPAGCGCWAWARSWPCCCTSRWTPCRLRR